jgi:hypothetical protein
MSVNLGHKRSFSWLYLRVQREGIVLVINSALNKTDMCTLKVVVF